MNVNKEVVSEMFNNKKYSAYYISNETGIPIKEVYHYIRENEEAKARHKAAIYAQREKDKLVG